MPGSSQLLPFELVHWIASGGNWATPRLRRRRFFVLVGCARAQQRRRVVLAANVASSPAV